MTRGSRFEMKCLVFCAAILAFSAVLGSPATAEAQRGSSENRSNGADPDPSLTVWARTRLDEATSLPPSDSGTEVTRRLEVIRAMYFLSVEDGDWVDAAKDSLNVLDPRISGGVDADIVSRAYRGALEVVRAKHSRWPPNKLEYLNEGARILDDLVAAHPENLEVRYLRLASYVFLPFFLRRDDSVAEDLSLLIDGLPDRPDAFSPALYQAVVSFVLGTGRVEGEAKARLEEVSESEDPGRPAQDDRGEIYG